MPSAVSGWLCVQALTPEAGESARFVAVDGRAPVDDAEFDDPLWRGRPTLLAVLPLCFRLPDGSDAPASPDGEGPGPVLLAALWAAPCAAFREGSAAGPSGQAAGVRVLVKRTAVPQFDRAVVMHQWHRGRPPLLYLWVLRWQPEQGPTWLLEQVKVDGSGSLIGGGKALVIRDILLQGERENGSERDRRPCRSGHGCGEGRAGG